jgi:DNA-directed RNA polymerase specialized sigma24 family protein
MSTPEIFTIHCVDRESRSRTGMSPDEVLAVIRLRQWGADKTALSCAHTTDYQRTGWKERRLRDADARIVRVLDFERALSQLSEEEQGALMLRYRERQHDSETAKLIHCSVRKLAYLIPQARRHLVEVLSRLDLL